MATHATSAFAPLVFTALVVRPIENVLASARLITGHSTFAFRYSPASLLVILAAWFAVTLLFNVLLLPATPVPWVWPALEVGFWCMTLYFLDRVAGGQSQYWRTIAAVASMSILIWGVGCILVISDVRKDWIAFILVALGLRGYSVVLAEGLGIRSALPAVFALLFALAGIATAIRHWVVGLLL